MRPVAHFVNCTVLIALASFASADAAAAAGCKLDSDETDKFTKERKFGTRRDSLESFWGDTRKDRQKDVYVSAWYNNGDRAIRIDLLLTNYVKRVPPKHELRNAIVIPKGSPLLVLMADGSIVTLHSANDIRTDARATGTPGSVSVDAGAYIYYPLDDDLVAALTSQSAAKIRVEAYETHYDFEIHEKSLDDIGNAIRCLQENI
jgi:hypothetical protein